MTISIIIPTYNEEQLIGALIFHLQKYGNGKVTQIIVSDGASVKLRQRFQIQLY